MKTYTISSVDKDFIESPVFYLHILNIESFLSIIEARIVMNLMNINSDMVKDNTSAKVILSFGMFLHE